MVVLDDASDHRAGVATDYGVASALYVHEVSARLVHLVRQAMEPGSPVEPVPLAALRSSDVDVPEAHPLDERLGSTDAKSMT